MTYSLPELVASLLSYSQKKGPDIELSYFDEIEWEKATENSIKNNKNTLSNFQLILLFFLTVPGRLDPRRSGVLDPSMEGEGLFKVE